MFTPKLSLFISLGMVLAARAYQITSPSDLGPSGPPWTSTGPNAIIWQRVSTDPDFFTIALVNEVSLPPPLWAIRRSGMTRVATCCALPTKSQVMQ
jgi:hypothetical protein